MYLYADDTLNAVRGRSSSDISNNLNIEINKAKFWLSDHEVSLNLNKTKVMLFRIIARLPRLDEVHVELEVVKIEAVNVYMYLGVTVYSRLTFSQHVEIVRKKAIPKIRTLSRISNYVSSDTIAYLYKSLIISRIEYADMIYDGLSQTDSQDL